MRTAGIEEIARSNYILAHLRRSLKMEREVIVKWAYGGYFNGAGLLNQAGTPGATIWFSTKRTESTPERMVTVELRDIRVIVETETDESVKEVILQADREFDSMWADNSDSLAAQVKRVLIWINCQSDEAINRKVDDLVESIVNATGATELFMKDELWPPVAEEDRYLDGVFRSLNLELIFQHPIREEDLISILRRFLPKIERPVYGFGHLNQYTDNPELPVFMHLYARHF